ncbi:septation protein A [Undibacterium oligocarboniphilum]|uniref:Inner membrane-spanning protein YciB n=1 Tax=Undibacterium oligocarboniphilum TaxID=666702 RepID=A0A850QB22_9BURK|nr:septation protein A [Undibacterium oligocarboniphilum]MBC3868800.1 septation protein A [Undibacterium oligocarboniphilum]NVO76781.1 septation protein A [Undibacterium oligocarboniphilum]
MKFLFDVFPVILFFVTFKWGESYPQAAQSYTAEYLSSFISGGISSADIAPILLATAVTLSASVVQISSLLIRRKKIDAMLWISFIIIMVFGGATIYFHSETFIKWKPTVLYWCYAGAFILSQFIFKKNLIQTAMGSQITLPDIIWARLSLTWIAFFVTMGLVNLFVAFQFSTSVWANFKLISMIGIMPAFVIVQSLFLSKYIEETE